MVAADLPPERDELQEQTLRLFLGLRLWQPVWARRLLLGIGLGGSGRALSLASVAAGAAGLFLESDPGLIRQVQRGGGTLFTVTTLEEATRILKNEVRQGHAIAVALRQTPAEAMADMLRRGLQPQAIGFSRPASEAEDTFLRALQQRGAAALSGLGLQAVAGCHDLDPALAAQLEGGWRIGDDQAGTLPERRRRDAELLLVAESYRDLPQPLSSLTVEWLRVAPGLLPRTRSRVMLQPLSKLSR